MAKMKKRNPQDATFRNIRALKKRVSALELKIVQDRNFIESVSCDVIVLMKIYKNARSNEWLTNKK